MEKVEGFLEVGTNGNGEVIINHPDLKRDERGIAHIVFSPRQARNLALLLTKNAAQAEKESSSPVVDRSARTLTDGSPVPLDESHRELKPNGQQKDYVVLSAAERAKGFVRPVRKVYIHVGIEPEMRGIVLIRPGKGACGSRTTMSKEIAETYARDPKFYNGTFCVSCNKHLPLNEFLWEGTTEQVGS